MTYTRRELEAILAARGGRAETYGANAWLNFTIRVTPEFLEQLLGGEFVTRTGRHLRFDGVSIDDAGLATPILVQPASAA